MKKRTIITTETREIWIVRNGELPGEPVDWVTSECPDDERDDLVSNEIDGRTSHRALVRAALIASLNR